MSERTSHPTNLYETNKLALASYLITSGAASLVKAYCSENSSNVIFVLSPKPTQDQITSFFNGTGQVSALAYHNAATNLKAAVFEAKRAATPVSDRGNTK